MRYLHRSSQISRSNLRLRRYRIDAHRTVRNLSFDAVSHRHPRRYRSIIQRKTRPFPIPPANCRCRTLPRSNGRSRHDLRLRQTLPKNGNHAHEPRRGLMPSSAPIFPPADSRRRIYACMSPDGRLMPSSAPNYPTIRPKAMALKGDGAQRRNPWASPPTKTSHA